MIRMKNRNQSPVGGWQYFQSQTGWNLIEHVPTAQWDFTLAVKSIIDHRIKNPRFNLPTDQLSVENELDYTNAKRMTSINGADSYIQSDESPPPPKSVPTRHPGLQGVVGGVRTVAQGAATIVDWIKSGAEAVSQDLSNQRASICATCEKNDKGDWTARFTVPAQNAIRTALNQRRDWKLTTTSDDKLQICSACLCPLPLKVHMPIGDIMKRMPKESFDDLVPQCWIRAESK